MSDLNLLPNVAKFQAAKIKQKKMAAEISIGLGVIWILIVVIIFGIWIVNQQRNVIEQRRYDRANEEFLDLKEEIFLTQQLKYKTKLVGQILEDRFEYSTVFEVIRGLFSDKIVIDKSEIKSTNQISISGTVVNIADFKEVENKIAQVTSKEIEGLASMVLKNMVLSESGWKFNMEVNLL